MFTPPPPVYPDEHLMQERARQNALDASNNRGRGRRGLKTLSTGDVLLFLGLAVVTALAVVAFFVFF